MTCPQHEELTESVKEMHKDIKEIRTALIGNFEQEGIVSQVRQHESLSRTIRGIVWKMIIAALTGGGLVVGIVKAVSEIGGN